jgi:hypothetical protein
MIHGEAWHGEGFHPAPARHFYVSRTYGNQGAVVD